MSKHGRDGYRTMVILFLVALIALAVLAISIVTSLSLKQ